MKWPAEGRVVFENVCMRYAPGLPLILTDVSAEIPGGSRLAIVGRSGSGKSSMLASLFRVVELA